jgi:hypothetical protein
MVKPALVLEVALLDCVAVNGDTVETATTIVVQDVKVALAVVAVVILQATKVVLAHNVVVEIGATQTTIAEGVAPTMEIAVEDSASRI